MEWFKVNNIENGVYAISEPYHWEKSRSYLFVGKDKAILIDTGSGLCPLKPIIDVLADLPITVTLTHCHWDHIGSINSFNEVYIHLLEMVMIVVHTPGHSPGSITLYEKTLNVVVIGDLLYKGTIYANYPSADPEKFYKYYLLIKSYKPKWVYPGHNDDMISGCIINEGFELLNKLNSIQKLKHGTGNHHSEHISFKF